LQNEWQTIGIYKDRYNQMKLRVGNIYLLSSGIKRQDCEKDRNLKKEIEEDRDGSGKSELLDGRHVRQCTQKKHHALGERTQQHAGRDFAKYSSNVLI